MNEKDKLSDEQMSVWTKQSLKILESLSVPILVIDRNYQTIGVNSAACTEFCASRDLILGRKCFDISHRLDKPCWREGISCPTKTAFETKKRVRCIHEHTHDGKTTFEEIISSPIFNDRGEAEFVIEELNDISELMQSKEITAHLKSIGFTFITLDLIGYQTGSLNQLL